MTLMDKIPLLFLLIGHRSGSIPSPEFEPLRDLIQVEVERPYTALVDDHTVKNDVPVRLQVVSIVSIDDN
jgi:hypothetical protein